jgi:peptide/nickel transport system substrate-binding protein
MPVSPAAVNKLGDKFATAPVCVGPWSFVERVPQDRIVLEKSQHYVDPGQVHFDRLVFRIIPDDNVRLANLRSGDIDVMHLVAPTDSVNLKKEGRFDVASVTGLAYTGITINLRNKSGKAQSPGDLGTPLANDPRVREALDLSLDRDAINQVAWDGQYTPGCTPVSPMSPFYDKSKKCPGRDVAKAKQLLAAAGLANGYALELTIVNDPQQRRFGEVIQAWPVRPDSTSPCGRASSPPRSPTTTTASCRRSPSAGAGGWTRTATSTSSTPARAASTPLTCATRRRTRS